jgi:c-di-GMP-binding flagellar brake protein YcgR
VDLAMGGSAIETGAPLQTGALLSLQMDAFDTEPRIVVEAAIVRSSGGTRHNVEFLRMADHERERLSRYILTLWLEGTQVARKGVRAPVTD